MEFETLPQLKDDPPLDISFIEIIIHSSPSSLFFFEKRVCISNSLRLQRSVSLCSAICSDIREKCNNPTKLKMEKFLIDINKISVLVTEFSPFCDPLKVPNFLNILLIFHQLLTVHEYYFFYFILLVMTPGKYQMA